MGGVHISKWLDNLASLGMMINPWPGDMKSYLQQPVIVSPVINQTKIEEPQTAVLPR